MSWQISPGRLDDGGIGTLSLEEDRIFKPSTGNRRRAEPDKAGKKSLPGVAKQREILAQGSLAALCNVLVEGKMARTVEEAT